MRFGSIALFAALAVLVAGCTGSGSGGASTPPPLTAPPVTSPATTPDRPPPTVTHSTPVAPPSPTVPSDVPTTGPNIKFGEKPPVMPVAATAHTAAGAEAFAKFFMGTVDWGYATIDGTYMRHFSGSGCLGCTSIADGLDRDRRAGRNYIGGRSSITAAKPGKAGALRQQIVSIDSTSFEELRRNGKFVTGDPAYTNLRYLLGISWDGRWLVTSLSVMQ